MTDAAEMSAEATALLLEYGRNITITSTVDSYDPTTGTNSPTLTNNTVRSSAPYNWQRRFVDGNTVREGDVFYFISATGLTFTPAQGQKVTDGSNVYRIVNAERFTLDHSGETFHAYELQARGDG